MRIASFDAEVVLTTDSATPGSREPAFPYLEESQSGRRISLTMKTSLGARTLVYPTPVFVVGTYDVAGRPNVMTASWEVSAAPSLRASRYRYARRPIPTETSWRGRHSRSAFLPKRT